MSDFLSVFESLFGNSGVPEIEKVIFNDPATIVFWADGSKTVVKTMPDQFDDEGNLIMKGDVFSPSVGLAEAIMKKYFGSGMKTKKAVKMFVDKNKKNKGEE